MDATATTGGTLPRCLKGIPLPTTSMGWNGDPESDSEDELPSLKDICYGRFKHLVARSDRYALDDGLGSTFQ